MIPAINIRGADFSDVVAIARQFAALWPDDAPSEHPAYMRHVGEVAAIVMGKPWSTMPLTLFVAKAEGGRVVGFIEVGLRSHADGCDARQRVGFIEGWYVEPEYRRRGIGRGLVAWAERWARDLGCSEMASDTWADNEPSQRAHESLGFEVVDRCVNYRKSLGA